MEKTIVMGENEAGGTGEGIQPNGELLKVLVTSVRSYEVEQLEIDLPGKILSALNISEGDEIKFIEENGRVYIEKA